MNRESLVTSLELSRELKKLGVKQESIFYWDSIITGDGFGLFMIGDVLNWAMQDSYDKPSDKSCSAFTAGELGEMLPGVIFKDGRRYFQSFHKNIHQENKDAVKYSYGFSYKAYWDNCYEDWYYAVCEKTESESRGKMLAHLHKNKLIEVKG